MRRGITRLAALMLALCLLAGCGAAQSGEGDGLRLYYPVPLEEHPGGDAISSVTVDWDTLPQEDRAAQAEAVLALLMGGCQEERFQSPVPSGTSLRSVEVKGGTAWVDFSGSYSQLSGMALTIADYCVALSLTQLEGVYAVRITVNGQELAYRDSNLFLASDVLLTSMDDVVRMLTAQLYFPDAGGAAAAPVRGTVHGGRGDRGADGWPHGGWPAGPDPRGGHRHHRPRGGRRVSAEPPVGGAGRGGRRHGGADAAWHRHVLAVAGGDHRRAGVPRRHVCGCV